MRVARWRNRNQEVHHASQIGSATKGRGCKSMSEKQLDEFASTKRKGKPEHVARPRTKKPASRSTARKSPARKGTARKTAARKGPSRRTSSR